MEFIGYLNQKLYTDVNSWILERDENDGKYYATAVEKKIDLTKCHFERGGFCGHFYGTEQAFHEAEPYKVGIPFEVKQNSEGEWYTTAPCISGTTSFQVLEEAQAFRKQLIENGAPAKAVDLQPIQTATTPYYVVVLYMRTPTGKLKTHRKSFGKAESYSRYFHDYNF